MLVLVDGQVGLGPLRRLAHLRGSGCGGSIAGQLRQGGGSSRGRTGGAAQWCSAGAALTCRHARALPGPNARRTSPSICSTALTDLATAAACMHEYSSAVHCNPKPAGQAPHRGRTRLEVRHRRWQQLPATTGAAAAALELPTSDSSLACIMSDITPPNKTFCAGCGMRAQGAPVNSDAPGGDRCLLQLSKCVSARASPAAAAGAEQASSAAGGRRRRQLLASSGC